jgi:hypothetical protein
MMVLVVVAFRKSTRGIKLNHFKLTVMRRYVLLIMLSLIHPFIILVYVATQLFRFLYVHESYTN